ncbi:hypothetical protein [Rickettsiella endosymbiont of Dermanyssus gallinae]|uniref:hypothetical protein n=1 Tax=Rickettsiella endosymbiont of Dermanyssus gallinae TaxID=2856608 RepID=UPI001C52D0F7|nr:hypothetical protein [Rickettsiella endosymbiont of Dermanyssus gallinae]
MLSSSGYQGPQDSEYTTGITETISEKIKTYLHAETFKKYNWQQFFQIIENDDFDITIRDMDWAAIIKYLFETLVQEGYFAHQRSYKNIHNLVDCASFSNLFHDNQLLEIETKYLVDEFFDNKHYSLQLKKIKIDFPGYWKNLKNHPHLISRIPLLISDIKNSPAATNIDEKINLLLSLNLKDIHNHPNIIKSLITI